ncbi:MAG: exo-beta-N-acetylmuramidase NamZ domain-containing protein [Rhodothermales bacterium]
MRLLLFLLVATFLPRCSPSASERPASTPDTTRVGEVKTGAQVLAEDGFRLLDGMRVGLIVNHTARVDTSHLVDVVHAAPNVELVALFGPEHGLRGTADAGEKVADGRDDRTGAPVYSLYGSARKPTPEMLDGVDALVFDIQDIGARFYTFISTMGLSMQAAADAGIPFVVLDRPNPLGGAYVSGFVLEPEHTSFVGQYAVPVVHGMTVGELARMIQGERLLPGLDGLQLHVVSMEGWERAMQWPDTGLPWIKTSPNIPDFETALVYPGACFFEATAASEGRGTETPFSLLGAPWADGAALADTLNARALPGVRFETARFTPRAIASMASHPKLEGEALQGIRYVVTDARAFQSVETGMHVLHAFYHQALAAHQAAFMAREDWLTRLAGTERLGRMLEEGASPEAVIAAWQAEVATFNQRRAAYLLY